MFDNLYVQPITFLGCRTTEGVIIGLFKASQVQYELKSIRHLRYTQYNTIEIG